MSLSVVLLEPEIPQNTGNIARTCACLGLPLHLVEPMGFRLSSKQLGRASMDYWDRVEIMRWPCTAAFLEAHESSRLRFFTGKAACSYVDADYDGDCYLVFGRESRGIDPALLAARGRDCVRIPMKPGMRSLNLSNAVAVAAYEAMRRSGFEGLE